MAMTGLPSHIASAIGNRKLRRDVARRTQSAKRRSDRRRLVRRRSSRRRDVRRRPPRAAAGHRHRAWQIAPQRSSRPWAFTRGEGLRNAAIAGQRIGALEASRTVEARRRTGSDPRAGRAPPVATHGALGGCAGMRTVWTGTVATASSSSASVRARGPQLVDQRERLQPSLGGQPASQSHNPTE